MPEEKKYQPLKVVKGEVVRPFRTEARGEVGPLSGTVRVVGARELRDFYDTEMPALQKQVGSATFAEAHLFARCLKSWDVEGEEAGATAPITPEIIGLLPDVVYTQLLGIITGVAGGEGALKN
jgi:hypothetical protein